MCGKVLTSSDGMIRDIYLLTNRRMCGTVKIREIREIEPEPSRCITVESDDRLFAAGGETGVEYISHNSVAQRSIIISCILRPDSWRFIGVDLKKVELSGYRKFSNVVLGIATTLEDALTCLRFGQQTMMKRYAEMEELRATHFNDLPEKGQSLMIMIDEMGELLSTTGVKALAADTYVPNLNGRKTLEELQPGDTVFDVEYKPTIVEQKYEPIEQDTYAVSITQDSTGSQETFVAGSEHYWVAIIKGEERLLTTEELYELFEATPENERSQIKFRRAVAPR